MLNWLTNLLLGRKCPQCGKRHKESGRGWWTRGWNRHCNQAVADTGWRCYECGHIVWDHSLAEYRESLPPWCVAYPDKTP